MWFRKVRFKNFGPFADLDLTLTRGSVGVFGRNGVGKSTLLDGIYALLTNDFNRFEGLKTDRVRNTAADGEESYLYGEVEHNGRVVKITRNFRPTKSKPGTVVVVDDAKPVTDSKKAEALLEETLGADKKLLDLYVFKQQHKVYDFLTTTPGDRAKAYQVLCRTEACEEIWSLFGTYLSKDAELTTEIVDNSDELVAEISEVKKQLAELAAEKKAQQSDLCEDKHRKTYENRVRAAARRTELLVSLTNTRVAVRAAKETFEKSNKTCDAKRTEHAEAQAKYDKKSGHADKVKYASRNWDNYEAYLRRRRDLEDQAKSFEVVAKTKSPPTPPDEQATQAQLMLWIADLKKELAVAKKTIETLDDTGVVACPTCGTEKKDLADHIAACRNTVATFPDRISDLRKRVDAVQDYQEAKIEYANWKAAHDAGVKANQDARDALEVVEQPAEFTKDKLKAWIEEYEALGLAVRKLATALKTEERIAQQDEAALIAKQARETEISEELAGIEVTPEQLEKAERRLAEHLVASRNVARLEGEETGLKKLQASKEADLKKLKAKLARSRRVRNLGKTVERAREVVHRDRLARRVAETNLARMEGDINEGLEGFGSPFWVEATQDLSFTVHKPGEPPQPAGFLSTGQRVILALAFWPSVASLWSSDLGILCLDEPTANLDADNRKLLTDALKRMTADARGRRQLIMVTHDPDLRTAFDQVVDLGA